MFCHVLFQKCAVFNCIVNIFIILCVFFHPQKLEELKRQTIPLKKKLESYLDLMPVIIFMNYKKKVYLLQVSPRALNDHENTGSMSKDPGPLFSLSVKDKFQILVECNSGILGCIRVCVKSHY